jgi:hypothetical protein
MGHHCECFCCPLRRRWAEETNAQRMGAETNGAIASQHGRCRCRFGTTWEQCGPEMNHGSTCSTTATKREGFACNCQWKRHEASGLGPTGTASPGTTVSYLRNSEALKCRNQAKFQQTVSRSFCLAVRQLWVHCCGPPSKTRTWPCPLQLLLVLASAVNLGPEYCGTYYLIHCLRL